MGESAFCMIDVLIAEDEPAILQSLTFILERAGWKIASVTDGDAALEALRQQRPRLLLLDIMLPKRSGLEVLKQIRAEPSLQAVQVLILTARGQQQDRQLAMELQADGFVTKPYANADVVDEVNRLLSRSEVG